MSRLTRLFGIPLAGILLFLIFVYRGFPYDRLGQVLAAEASRSLGAQVRIQETGPWMTLAGPGLEARGVDLRWPDGRRLQLETAAGRPAWSISWLRGRSAFHLELDGPSGQVEGIWTRRVGWSGELRQLDLAVLPIELWWPGLMPEGRVDAEIDLLLTEAGPEGDIRFEAREGSLRLGQTPFPVSYDRLHGELVLGGGRWLEVKQLALEGPILSGNGSGQIGASQRFAHAPLSLSFEIEKTAAGLDRLLRSAGVRVGRKGKSRVRVEGTPSAPVLR